MTKMWENSGLSEKHSVLFLLTHPGTQPQKQKQINKENPPLGHCQSRSMTYLTLFIEGVRGPLFRGPLIISLYGIV